MRWIFPVYLAWLVPSLGSISWAADPVVLLLTSPREAELDNIVMLRQQRLLQVENLHLKGIYHAQEQSRYRAAHHYLTSNKIDWISLESINCPLQPETAFSKNDCTEPFRSLWKNSTGIIFTGGADIPPGLYGKPTSLLTVVSDPARHWFEISLLVHLLRGDRSKNLMAFLTARPDYPVLGLCLGMQTMNVALGGTLIQDIPSQIYERQSVEDYAKLGIDRLHRNPLAQLDPHPDVGWGILHRIKLVKHPLAQQFGAGEKQVQVLSLHHQALGKRGKDLVVWARSMDGKVVEAVAHRLYKAVVGVQFHPEKRVLRDPTVVYRKKRTAQTANSIAEDFLADKAARRFQREFWSWFSQSLQTHSARSE